ncbi:MAG: M6 family metalloprotease domain-containing protein [Phycisphaerae bacterium]
MGRNCGRAPQWLACVVVVQAALCFRHAAYAVPASPHPFTVTQADGTAIVLYVRGDEYFNWWEDSGSYTVVRHGNEYVYAELGVDGRLAPTEWRVGEADPAATGLSRRVLPTREVQNSIRAQRMASPGGSGRAPTSPSTTGVVNNVVILMQFANHSGRVLPTTADFDVIFNAAGPTPPVAPTGSVRSVYLEDSYGQLQIDSTVFGWYLLPETEQFYTHGTSGLGPPKTYIIDALDLADPDIDFSLFDDDGDGFVDAIAFIHSGYGAEFGGTDVDGTAQADRMWSHRSSIPTWTSDEGIMVESYHISSGLWGLNGSQPGRIGVICHETGHFFGIPDLYDTNGGGEGIGSWGMMANSWGFDGTQLHPPHFCAWSKIRLGWLTPTVISVPGVYQAMAVETSATVYRVDAGFPPDEYLLIENREPMGHESAMPQGGLAVFHIDDTSGYSDEGYPGQPGWPENGNHYRVSLLQADGLYNLERGHNRGDAGDPYHGGVGGVSAINSSTVPNTDAYQGGNAFPTGNSIWEISAASAMMTFRLGYNDVLPADPPHDARKNRYVSFKPNNPASSAALRVEMVEGPGASGVLGWVSAPIDPAGTGDWVATVVADPVIRAWPEDTVHIGDCEVVPAATYHIAASADTVTFGSPLVVATIRRPGARFYGDTVGQGTGDLPPLPGFTAPNGVVNVTDVQAYILTAQGSSSPSAHTTWVDLHGLGDGTPPNFILNVSDLQRIKFGFEGREYVATPGQLNPADCP